MKSKRNFKKNTIRRDISRCMLKAITEKYPNLDYQEFVAASLENILNLTDFARKETPDFEKNLQKAYSLTNSTAQNLMNQMFEVQ